MSSTNVSPGSVSALIPRPARACRQNWWVVAMVAESKSAVRPGQPLQRGLALEPWPGCQGAHDRVRVGQCGDRLTQRVARAGESLPDAFAQLPGGAAAERDHEQLVDGRAALGDVAGGQGCDRECLAGACAGLQQSGARGHLAEQVERCRGGRAVLGHRWAPRASRIGSQTRRARAPNRLGSSGYPSCAGRGGWRVRTSKPASGPHRVTTSASSRSAPNLAFHPPNSAARCAALAVAPRARRVGVLVPAVGQQGQGGHQPGPVQRREVRQEPGGVGGRRRVQGPAAVLGDQVRRPSVGRGRRRRQPAARARAPGLGRPWIASRWPGRCSDRRHRGWCRPGASPDPRSSVTLTCRGGPVRSAVTVAARPTTSAPMPARTAEPQGTRRQRTTMTLGARHVGCGLPARQQRQGPVADRPAFQAVEVDRDPLRRRVVLPTQCQLRSACAGTQPAGRPGRNAGPAGTTRAREPREGPRPGTQGPGPGAVRRIGRRPTRVGHG